MAQPNYTPIQLYSSSTATNTPLAANLAAGELAINTADGILFYKDSSNVVQKIGYKLTPTTAGGTGLTSFTNGGIVYASSTSALATGSALTYNGTKLTSSASGAISGVFNRNTSSGATLDIQVVGGSVGTLGSDTGGNGRFDIVAATSLQLRSTGANQFISFDTGGSTAMTIASATGGVGAVGIGYTSLTSVGNNGLAVLGNVGIGTSTPATKLEVSVASSDATLNQEVLRVSTTGRSAGGGTAGRSAVISFYDSANATLTGAIGGFRTNSNVDFSGGLKFFYNSSSASSGVSTLTEGMRLDASGNLGLGVTPFTGWAGGSGANTVKAFQIGLYGTVDYNGGGYTNIGSNYYNASGSYKYGASDYATRFSQGGGIFQWYTSTISGTQNATIAGFTTPVMTLSASEYGVLTVGSQGSVGGLGTGYGTIGAWGSAGGGYRIYRGTGAGTSIAYLYADASGVFLYGQEAVPMVFSTSGSEKMRLDASGNLLVGTTSDVTNGGMKIFPNYDATGSTSFEIGHITGSSSGNRFGGFKYAGTLIGTITQNGTTGVLYNLTSDYRLKNNQQALTGAKDFIMALKPKKWQWWDGSGEGVGFVAHEFMEVAKHSGNGEKDAVDSDGKPVYQSIQPSSSEVMANLVAFVQELKAEFDAYKASHP